MVSSEIVRGLPHAGKKEIIDESFPTGFRGTPVEQTCRLPFQPEGVPSRGWCRSVRCRRIIPIAWYGANRLRARPAGIWHAGVPPTWHLDCITVHRDIVSRGCD